MSRVIFPDPEIWTTTRKDTSMTTNVPSDNAAIVAMARDFQVTYHLTDSGDDLIGVCVEDDEIGEFAMMLTKEQAQKVATRLTALLCALPEVRAAKQRRENRENN
ncbi:hypothetical protein MHAE_08488 [Mycobacterium haemophilum DSM 44634]|uniref:hypothetical protein n=1 Tax=Mycobacterium haemophilum TaxID=29311 RepID=UPI0006552644|nr:hypothetical protein [Mycobacterium haemophilum]AKN15686.1 hypothetical protein B586_02500 [Mycobacterium haemophilum DSM 44634]MCV7341229.1 hypothetical protein [Mycobacterium haemophilum DSM 44634]